MADRYDGSVRIKTDADTTPAEKQLTSRPPLSKS